MRLVLQVFRRNFATKKSSRAALLQDVSKIPVCDANSKSDRRVYVWGLSETGALGTHKSLKKQSQKQAAFIQHPTRLQFAETHEVLDVACGYGFTAFAVKRTDGYSLFGTGLNTDSQLGFQSVGGTSRNKSLELLTYPAPIALPAAAPEKPVQIVKCAAGRAHLLALADDAKVFALGNNSYGQCGRSIVKGEKYSESDMVHTIDGVGGESVKDVHCGQDHSFLLTTSGKVYACGWGADGQTGLGHYDATGIPTAVGGDIQGEAIVKLAGSVDCVLALNGKGEVFGWGNSEYGQLQVDGDEQQINTPVALTFLKGLGKIVDIAAGGSSCLVLNENGDVFVWGYGILGLGPNVDHVRHPSQIPATLFGRNEFSPASRVTSIHSGISHMAALNDQHDMYTWGRNRSGCLGQGHKNDQYFPLKASVGAKVVRASCGVDHTVVMGRSFV